MNFNQILLILLCISIISCKTDKVTDEKKYDKPIDNFQSIIDSIYKSNPESIGIMAHIESPKNGISWSGGKGYSDLENKTELIVNQPALIASSIKTYIAASILRLQEQNILTIEDDIAKFLSKETYDLFESDGYDFDSIKIKHLLSHTSGIEDYANKEYLDWVDKHPKHRWSRKEQLELATQVGNPLGKPGHTFSYADANYLLCTEIIEQATKKPFYEAIRTLLKYETLNLNNTWFPTLEEKPTNTLELVHQYWTEKNWDSYNQDISWDLYGGGGIATNTEELAKFSYNLFNKKIIENQDVLNLIFSKIEISSGKDNKYGLGLSETEVKGLKAYGHGGFWGTVVLYFPKLDASISVFVLDRNQGKLRSNVLQALVTELTAQLFPLEKTVVADNYELHQVKKAEATLILYPGGGSTAKETKEEFDILTAARANNISVLLMNFNRHLWIDEAKTKELSQELEEIYSKYKLKKNDVFIGGMSIGGNVALTLSNYLHQEKTSIAPKGVFIVDSPLDLYALYESSIIDTKNPEFDEERLAEPKGIINYLEANFGQEEKLLKNIQEASPFTLKTRYINIPQLKGCKLRFYTEPDKQWWKENRQTDFEYTNAYTLRKISEILNEKQWMKFEIIETENKGYRANGERHPHSWSIVDVNDLMMWIGG